MSLPREIGKNLGVRRRVLIYQTKSCRIRVGITPQKLADQRDTVLGVAKGRNSRAGPALDKILFRIWYLC